jgi:Tol biopolymer transport system component
MRSMVVVAVLLATVVAASAALAVPRGKNGPIYFENFSDVSNSGDIWVVRPDGSGLKNLTEASTAEESDPAASPNGKQVAYISTASGGSFVYVMNSDGSGAHKIGSSGAAERSPAWSVDGKKIAFSRCTAIDPDSGDCTTAQIAVMNADGSNVRFLTAASANVVDDRPAWAPSGKTIAFQRTSGSGAISLLTVSAAGGVAPKKIFADGSSIDLSPSYSPDGKKIAFASDATGKESIYTVNFNGHSVKKLVSELPDPDDPSIGGGTENPAYAPAGDKVVYTAGGDLWTVSITGKGAKQITQGGGDDADWARA